MNMLNILAIILGGIGAATAFVLAERIYYSDGEMGRRFALAGAQAKRDGGQ